MPALLVVAVWRAIVIEARPGADAAHRARHQKSFGQPFGWPPLPAQDGAQDHHAMNDTSPTAPATLERWPAQRVGDAVVGVQTIQLDVPAVAAALSQRLYSAGVPVTPERAVTFARALSLVSPVSRSYLYCTARAIFVSSAAHLPVFDRVFASVFGSRLNASDEANDAGDARS
jgi:hypothetical protein